MVADPNESESDTVRPSWTFSFLQGRNGSVSIDYQEARQDSSIRFRNNLRQSGLESPFGSIEFRGL